MKKILKYAFLASLVFGLASCLKDKDFDNNVIGLNLDNAPKVIELGISASPLKEKTIGLNFIDQIVDVSLVTVRLAAREPASEDIIVVLDTTGTEAITLSKGQVNFNRAPLLYTLPATGLSVTIPKGKREGNLMVKTNASLFNPSLSYGINFKIKSVSKPGFEISRNFNEFYTILGAKNPYDGVYSVLSGLVTRYTSPGVPQGDALSGPVGGNPNITLKTISANTVEVLNLRWSGGTSGVAGIDNLRLTVDPITNLVTMTSLGNATLANWPGRENSYDPINKVFKLAFRWNPTANVREYEMIIKML